MSNNIYVTNGAVKYVGGTITETTGKDISAATYVMGLSTSQAIPPVSWVAPSVSTVGPGIPNGNPVIPTTAQRILKLLVNNTTTPGTYYCWGRITDSPEIEPLVLQGPITVI